MTEDHIKSIVDTMKYEEFDDDNPLIIEQGKVANKVYIVLAGQVSIMAASGLNRWLEDLIANWLTLWHHNRR